VLSQEILRKLRLVSLTIIGSRPMYSTAAGMIFLACMMSAVPIKTDSVALHLHLPHCQLCH